MDEYGDSAEGEAEDAAPARSIMELMDANNIADMLEDDELSEIARRVTEEYEIDKGSRTEWLERNKVAMDLAMLVADEKTYPFTKASNVKYPLLTTAALQFNARAYPAVVSGNRVVKCSVWGRDEDGKKAERAERVSEHMSYQLLSEMPEWEEDTDRLLVILPISGAIFRKVYYDPALGRKCTRLITADRLVVNYLARSIDDVPRITEEMFLYPYEIEERIRGGRFVEFEYGTASPAPSSDDDKAPADTSNDAPHLLLEQHRLWDLDGDGYPEPYIVTVHEQSGKVCRIVANYTADTVRISEDGKVAAIRRQTYYVKYQFLPSPDGGFYGMGFGTLLGPIGETINSTLNMMMDMGHLSTVQGGLISATLGEREKKIRLDPGEWRVVQSPGKLSESIMPIKYEGPSATLFQLLGLLIEAGKEMAAVKDVLTGEGQGKNASPTTTLALIEQGLQVFTAIYKRIHRALKAELGIHARLNRQYLEAERYNRFTDGDEQYDPAADYSEEDMDILPVSDPSVSSRMQKLAKAQFVMEVLAGNPLGNQEEALRRVLSAGEVEDIDKLITPPPAPPPEELAFMEMMKKLSAQEMVEKIKRLQTQQLKDVADAEAAEVGNNLSVYDGYLRSLEVEHGMEMDLAGQGGLPGMEGQPDDPMGAGMPPEAGEPAQGPAGQGALPVEQPPAGGLGAPPA